MARIRQKVFTLTNKPVDCSLIRIYRATATGIDYNAEFKDIPAEGKDTIVMPTDVDWSWEDRNYFIGVSYLDAAGNESNIKELISPFDFTPPPTPEVEVADGEWIYV